jgi:hypothetical protein
MGCVASTLFIYNMIDRGSPGRGVAGAKYDLKHLLDKSDEFSLLRNYNELCEVIELSKKQGKLKHTVWMEEQSYNLKCLSRDLWWV